MGTFIIYFTSRIVFIQQSSDSHEAQCFIALIYTMLLKFSTILMKVKE